jgi:hypothetical protein
MIHLRMKGDCIRRDTLGAGGHIRRKGTADYCINLNVNGGITGVHLRGCCIEQSSTLGFCFLH